MTTLIQNEQKRQKIMARMREHLVPVLEHCRGGWVGLFLQGSQNYNLDYEGSDIDTKAIMLPSFSDFVLNAKPLSTTHIMENNEHVDFKDIRLMFDCIKKQNVNFVEILFTPYSIINPEYADLFQPVLDAREEIARYNNYAGMNCIMGMHIALFVFGHRLNCSAHQCPCFFQRVATALHLFEIITLVTDKTVSVRLAGFVTGHKLPQPQSMVKLLRVIPKCLNLVHCGRVGVLHCLLLFQSHTVPVSINQHANEVLQKAAVEILKRSFLKEIQGGK